MYNDDIYMMHSPSLLQEYLFSLSRALHQPSETSTIDIQLLTINASTLYLSEAITQTNTSNKLS